MADKVWPSKEPRMPVAVHGAGPAPRVLRAAGRQAERAIETVAFSTKVNGAAADGGKWERGGETGGEKKKQGRIGQHVHTRTQPRTAKGAAEGD